jgi:hypothetical protein
VKILTWNRQKSTGIPTIRSLYYHRDFDGTVSAAMLVSVSKRRLRLYPVDYHLKSIWALKRLEKRTAIVDFLFHPDAILWIDHHADPFVLPSWKEKLAHTPFHVWDTSAPSCPPLIIRALPFPIYLQQHFAPYIHWSSIIDSAAYESAEDATDLSNPYLLVSEVLALPSTNGLSNLIAREIAASDVNAVLSHPRVEPLANTVVETETRLRRELLPRIEYDGLVAFLDQSFLYSHFQRYYPYLIHPDASYVVGIYRDQNSFTVSVGANPWKPEPEVNVGLLCRSLGGGGRKNVGGVPAGSSGEAQIIASEIRNQLHKLARVPQFA